MKSKILATAIAGAGIALSPLASATAQENQPASEVQIQNGKVSGVRADGIVSYKGIPFAAPPVGDLRWRAPQPASDWSGVRRANAYGPICTQPASNSDTEQPAQSEDCLTLNIWHPADMEPNAELPVMLWIHGGGSSRGSGSAPRYDGTALAQEGVVVVTINYRLGALGYFVHPALENAADEISEDGMTANYGLMDQLSAMRWVEQNISNFGGDSENVTIFGVSAGGCYTNMWMTTSVAKGLFDRAITQSCPGFIESRTMAEGMDRGTALAQDLGVTGDDAQTLAELRALPAENFVTPKALKGTYPFIDGVLVDRDPFAKLEDGEVEAMPWRLGGSSFDASYLPYYGVDISQPLAAYTPEEQSSILEVYAPTDATGEEIREASLLFLTDMVIGASDRLFATVAANAGAPTWLYNFGYLGTEMDQDAVGVPHGGELGYVFGNPGPGTSMTSEQDRAVSASVRKLWTDFAKGQLPLSESWSDESSTYVIAKDGEITSERNWREKQLDLALPFARNNAGRWDP